MLSSWADERAQQIPVLRPPPLAEVADVRGALARDHGGPVGRALACEGEDVPDGAAVRHELLAGRAGLVGLEAAEVDELAVVAVLLGVAHGAVVLQLAGGDAGHVLGAAAVRAPLAGLHGLALADVAAGAAVALGVLEADGL